MKAVQTDHGAVHVRAHGPEDGAPVIFANSLGTGFTIWDEVVAALPAGVRAIRYDKRGHGLSEVHGRDWGMGDLVAEAAAVADAFGARDAVVVGLSIGGLIAQGLAAERPDIVRAMVLCDTGAKIGNPEMWDERIANVDRIGMAGMAPAIVERWFTAEYLAANPALAGVWRSMVARTGPDGYAGCSAAIKGTDLWESTARLRIPTLGVAGDADIATPPDLVRETTDLIPGARFELIRRSGHLPCIEQPAALSALINGFLVDTGHV